MGMKGFCVYLDAALGAAMRHFAEIFVEIRLAPPVTTTAWTISILPVSRARPPYSDVSQVGFVGM